jgi:hypothetical protein
MEPIFADSASETVTAELRAQLNAAVATLPLPTASPLLRTSCPTLEKQLIQLHSNNCQYKDWGQKLENCASQATY